MEKNQIPDWFLKQAWEKYQEEKNRYDWSKQARPEQKLPEEYWPIVLAMAGRGFGKLLNLNTFLATPDGWTTMGAVQPGDTLFDEAGRPTKVLAKYAPPVNQAYRITFSDGTYLEADAEHQWVSWVHRDRKQYLRKTKANDFPADWPKYRQPIQGPKGEIIDECGPAVRTTEEIKRTLRQGNKRKDLNHCIPLNRPLQTPPIDFPMPPWMLGYWLSHSELPIKDWRSLKGLARGSIEQRLELLRGLMDSNGYAGESGSLKFASKSLLLAQLVQELVRSLGERCTFYEGRAKLYGVDCGPRYRVYWCATLFNPFSLPRTAETVPDRDNQALRLRHRMVTSIEPIPAPKMACITVDSPNEMYLAGEAMIPTHNTRMGAEAVRQKWEEGYNRIGVIAPTANDLREVITEGESGILAVHPSHARPTYYATKRRLEWPNGAICNLYCASEDTEALTKEGWKTYDLLEEGELIRTLNVETGLAEWQPVKKLNIFEVTEEPVVSIEKQMHSSLVTRNHKWPLYHKETGKIRVKSSVDDFNSKDGILLSADPSEDWFGCSPYSDGFVASLGWFTGEGHWRIQKGRRRITGQIAQKCRDSYIEWALEDWMGRPKRSLKGVREPAWTAYGGYGSGESVRLIQYALTEEAIKPLLEECFEPKNKSVSIEFINKLTPYQRELFIKAFLDGDGCWKGSYNSAYIAQSVDSRLDSLEYAAILNGWGVKREGRHNPKRIGREYGLTLTKSKRGRVVYPIHIAKGTDAREYTTYTGTVWCPTVDNGTWLAKRNGTIFYTGNSAEEPDRLRGPQHEFLWCFISGTKIAIPGECEKKIEELGVGDWVETRAGPRPIQATGSRKSRVGLVRFSDGSSLTGTAEHPIMTSYGWTRLADLKHGDQVCAMNASSGMEFAGMFTPMGIMSIGGLGQRGGKTGIGCIGQYIDTILGKFRRAWKSIILMKTQRTTIPRTSNFWEKASIKRNIRPRGRLIRIGSLCRGLSGSALDVVGQYIERLRKGKYSAGPATIDRHTSGLKQKESVSTVGQCSSVNRGNSVVSVVSTWGAVGRATVHNISVAGQPEFFANGILVHNCDEFAAYKNVDEVYSNAMLGLRLGKKPQALITTTPRPIPILRKLLSRDNVKLIQGATHDNLDNLAPTFKEEILEEYAGTRLEAQEILGQLIEEVEGALWSYEMLDQVRWMDQPPQMNRVVVGVDPPGSPTTDCGIVVAGRSGRRGFVLADATTKGKPEHWARRAVQAAAKWNANAIVAEKNFGGDMVEATIRGISREIPIKLVQASKGKQARAEPVSALYEQMRVYHCGRFTKLEDEMCTYIGDPKQDSPNRLDALTWSMHELLVRRTGRKSLVWGRNKGTE